MKRHLAVFIIILHLICIFPSVHTIYAYYDCCSAETCQREIVRPVSEAEIEAHSAPEVTPLTVDSDLLNDRYYQQVTNQVNIFDAPDGNVIGTLDKGFNFVTTLSVQGDWAEINPGQWVRTENLNNSNSIISNFTGVILPEESLPYPMAWALINMYPSKAPGGNPSESNSMIWRYTRLYLYSSAVVDDGSVWYQVGVDQWVHQFNVAKMLPVEKPADVDTDYWISIDLYEQTLVAYEGNRPVFSTLIASGLNRWPTNEGLYHIYYRHLREGMSGGQPGDDFYYLEEVPWTMFFDEGRALHGAYWHDGFGYRRSHGCVNLSITDAHWLYVWVAAEMGSMASADRENGPAVYIYSSGQYS